MGAGKTIELKIGDNQVIVRDYGRGIPLGKVVDVVSKMNTLKYDSRAFKKSVGLNGVDKAIKRLSSSFVVESVREEQTKKAAFEYGALVEEDNQRQLKPAEELKYLLFLITLMLKTINSAQSTSFE